MKNLENKLYSIKKKISNKVVKLGFFIGRKKIILQNEAIFDLPQHIEVKIYAKITFGQSGPSYIQKAQVRWHHGTPALN